MAEDGGGVSSVESLFLIEGILLFVFAAAVGSIARDMKGRDEEE